MDITNFALLSALYGDANRNLYNEVYFPIIRYSLFFQMSIEDKSSDGYSKIDSLKDVILDKFDISIPIPVLTGALQRIGQHDSDIEIFEKGESFKILPKWAANQTESVSVIDRKADILKERMSEIETKFQAFITEENIQCEYTFAEFFSNHTSELLVFLNGEISDNPSVHDFATSSDAKYSNLMRFVNLLRETESELYLVAETFFWSTVVAAFLKRDQDVLKDRNEKTEYYLDTSLVLALLDLSDTYSVRHALELKDMIENSGHVVCVHPMTIREVKGILQAASQNGVPDTTSGIFDAYNRRNLNPTDLMHISSNMRKTLEKQQVVILKCADADLDEAEHKYTSNGSVLELGRLRNHNQNYTPDFREIHDIFMRDFIKQQRKKRKSLPSHGNQPLAYFLSTNSQLIDFCYIPSLQKEQLMIHPKNVIANLWINGALSKDLCRSGLSEIISRCMAANNIDARSRMSVLVKCSEKYIEDEEERRNFCRNVYKGIIRQAKAVTPLVDKTISIWNEDGKTEEKQNSLRSTMTELVIKVEQESENNNGQLFLLTEKFARLESDLEKTRDNYESQIKAILKDREEQAKELSAIRENENKLKERDLALQLKTDLLERRDQLKENLRIKSESKAKLDFDLSNAITDTRYYIEMVFGCIIILGVVAFIIWLAMEKGVKGLLVGSGIGIVPAIWAFVGLCGKFSSNQEKKQKYRLKQREKWMTAHPEYDKTCEEILKLEQAIEKIESELSQIQLQS